MFIQNRIGLNWTKYFNYSNQLSKSEFLKTAKIDPKPKILFFIRKILLNHFITLTIFFSI